MDDDDRRHQTAPLTHSVPVTALSALGRHVSIKATETELAAVASACGLISAKSLCAEFQVTQGAGSLLAVQGSLEGDVVQACCVTLEPVAEHVEGEIVLTYTLDPAASGLEVDIIIDDEDPPEPVTDGHIDFGAIVVEHLVLNLDPYPRAPEARFNTEALEISEETPKSGRISPFSVLENLKLPDRDP